MSYQEDTIDWYAIDKIDSWLDSNVPGKYREQPLAQDWARISKIGEELGEAIQAFIGYTGQNPRKGYDGTTNYEVMNELADVILTAILAIQHFTKNTSSTRNIIRAKTLHITQRNPEILHIDD